MFLDRFSCLNRKTRGKRIQIRIGLYFGGIEVLN